tara:strand:- start:96 stop:1172 length:1077 start_codon:yes stop_codon:yes gene_type:complete
MIAFNVNPDIKKSETLPSEFYLDNKYFKFCSESLFPSSWQLIADIDIFEKNNTYPFSFLEGFIDEPLVLVKNGNSIICLSNVCTHRAHLISTEPCQNNKLRCIYHGRKFNLDGSFHSMPGFKDVENFPTTKDNLEHIPIYKWKKFILVSLEKNIDISPVFKDIESRLPNFPFEELFYDKKNSYTGQIKAHWAMYCENYLEGFHVPFVHKGLASEIDMGNYRTVLLENAVLQIAEDEKGSKILKNLYKPNENVYALYYWVFPNIMFNFYSWGLSINIIEPLDNNYTRIRFLSYPIKTRSQPDEGEATLDRVEKEDQAVVQNVQKGIRSRYYSSGRYSPKYEKGVHHFHLLINKFIQSYK